MILSKLIFFLTFLTLSFSANAQLNYEGIESFEAIYTVNADGTVSVAEQIKYFFPEERHGIYRQIPLEKVNLDGDKFLMSVENILVTDARGNKIQYKDETTSSQIYLKIGDPNSYVSGSKDYVISYEISGALTYFSDHDEFYWNVTGNDWDVPINNVSATIVLPEEIEGEISANCFTGYLQSTNSDCEYSISENTVNIGTTTPLGISEGITIAVFFPRGYVEVLEPVKNNSDLLFAIIFSTIILVFYIILPIYFILKAIKLRKKTEEEKRVVAAWFDPPKNNSGRFLTASEVGIVHDKKADIRDFTAGIVQLAQKGYIKIVEIPKKNVFTQQDFELIRLKEADNELEKHEEKILNILFNEKKVSYKKIVKVIGDMGTKEIKQDDFMDNKEVPTVLISELSKRTSMSEDIRSFFSDISKDLVKDNIFEKDPIKTRESWLVGVIMGGVFFNPLFILASALMMGSAKRTKTGGNAYAVVESMNNFVKSQEKQLEFQAKNQMMFEKLLPYAIALGVEKIWVERFKDISFAKSDWYESSQGYNALAFSSFTNNFTTAVSKNVSMTSSRSSSGFSSGGGGFSGGGGGGGGGGSW